MQRNAVDVVVTLFQDFPIPFQVGAHGRTAGAAGDEPERVIHIAHLTGSVSSFQSVFGGGHVADLPRTVHLVAEAPVLHIVGICYAVLAAQVAPMRAFLDVTRFAQRSGLLWS